MYASECLNCGETSHNEGSCNKHNSMRVYLSGFNTESELSIEINKMEKLRNYLYSEVELIYILDSIKVEIKKDTMIDLEINPDLIDKYDLYNINDIYDREQRLLLYNLQLKCQELETIEIIDMDGNIMPIKQIMSKMYPNNIIENIYKIYVTKLKRKIEIKKLLNEYNINCNYEIASFEIDKRIEFLYKKYVEIL